MKIASAKLIPIDKGDVMNMLDDESLYMVKVNTKPNTKGRYLSSKLVPSMTVREITAAISDPVVCFMKVEEEL